MKLLAWKMVFKTKLKKNIKIMLKLQLYLHTVARQKPALRACERSTKKHP